MTEATQALATVVAVRSYSRCSGRTSREAETARPRRRAGRLGWGSGGGEVVQLGSGLAADEEDVAEAAGGDEGGAGAFALDDGVGGHGGAVDHVVGLGLHLREAVQEGAGGVVRRRGPLVHGEAAVFDEQENGEG